MWTQREKLRAQVHGDTTAGHSGFPQVPSSMPPSRLATSTP